MIKSGFFNSVNGDRTYNADMISRMFTGVLSDGVYRAVGAGCKVEPVSGMTVKIGTGRACVSDRWAEIETEEAVTLSAASVTYPRWTAVVLRLDRTARNITIETKDGTPAAAPVKPAIEKGSDVYEICLAYIYVAASATTITEANITDTRADAQICGYVRLLASQQIQRGEASITTEEATAVIDIPESLDYESGDVLDVYVSGLRIPAADYTVNVSAQTITFDYTLDSGASVQITSLKSVSLDMSAVSEIIDEINGEVV